MASHMGALMSRSPTGRIVILWLTAVAGLFAQTAPPMKIAATEMDSSALVAAAAPGIGPFASALATANVPAGFVVRLDDQTSEGPSSRMPISGSRVSVGKAVERFVESHGGYAVRQSDWALVLRPTALTVCDAVLDQRLPDVRISDPAYVALWRLARIVNPNETPAAPPAVVCGGACDAAEQHYDSQITLDLNKATLQEALSQLVSQAPGLVWVLRDQRPPARSAGPADRICRLSYLDATRSIETSYVFARATHAAK
jgi:hypothetical protein